MDQVLEVAGMLSSNPGKGMQSFKYLTLYCPSFNCGKWHHSGRELVTSGKFRALNVKMLSMGLEEDFVEKQVERAEACEDRESNIQGEDFVEQPTEEAAVTIPEVEGADNSDPQELSANQIVKAELSFRYYDGNSSGNGLVINCVGYDGAEEDCGLVGRLTGMCEEFHCTMESTSICDEADLGGGIKEEDSEENR